MQLDRWGGVGAPRDHVHLVAGARQPVRDLPDRVLDASAGPFEALDHQGDAESAKVRKAAHEALTAITGKSIAYAASTEALRTPDETKAYRKWKSWWQRYEEQWKRLQAKNDTQRLELEEQLAKIAEGKNPNAEDEDDEDEELE